MIKDAGEQIHYQALLMMKKRTTSNFRSKFLQAQKNIKNQANVVVSSIAFYNLYLFYNHGWGVVTTDNKLALEYLKKSMHLGYPKAGADLARRYLEEKKLYRASECIKECTKQFFNIYNDDEKDKHKEEYKDMEELLRLVESKLKEVDSPKLSPKIRI